MLANLATWFLDPSGLTPHGFCLSWEPGLIWLHAVSDGAIALAYFTIPLALAIFARRRQDLVFKPVFWLFATFILLCGTTHWLSILTLFVPAYALEGAVKAATAAVSVVTAAALWPLLPKALSLPSASQLHDANAALQASEARLRTSFERSPVPMQVLDADHRLMAVSDTWLTMLGYQRNDVIGYPIGQFLSPDKLCRADPARADRDLRIVERRFICSDGAVIEAEVSSRFDHDINNAWTVAVIVDITARRRAEAALRASEERLHQAQKMEAVGQLTGGIAHDFNNMLQGMSSGLEMLERRIEQGNRERLSDYIGAVRTSIDRAARLTQRMLAFARRQTLQPRPTDANVLVRGLEEMFRRTLGAHIALQLRLGALRWPALCDPNQLESALLNLAINARDAMPEGGTLEIVTTDRRIEGRDLSAENEAVPGDYVEIAVIDNGAGMVETVKSRAFEPFFTTKPLGQGTGLGLSQIYGFIRQSGGLVRLESEPGRGTVIRLLLPRSTDATAAPATPFSTPPAVRFAGASRSTILVVDDEPIIRALIVEMLRDIGLNMLEASESDGALRLLKQSPAPDLLITDVGLPGRDGRQLAEQARALHPNLPILLMTGYAGDAVELASLPHGIELIRKPFTLEALAGRVVTALDLAGRIDQLA